MMAEQQTAVKDGALMVGFYESDITPPLGCSIPGYFNQRLGSDVKDRLYAKALVVQNESGIAAILAVDSCGVTRESCDAICAKITEYTGIPSDRVMISSTHTHTGGPTQIKDEILIFETHNPRDDIYLEMVRQLAADAVILAYQRMREATAAFGSGEVKGISFVRNYVMKNGTVKTNPGRLNPDIVKPYSDIDPALPVLCFFDGDKPLGALWCFACHQDCVDGTEYSGDYSSIVAKELKKQYGEDFVSVYVPGTCGNINHFDVSRAGDAPDHYAMMGRTIAKEAVSVISKAERCNLDTIAVEKKEIVMKKRMPTAEERAKAEHIVETVKMEEGVKLDASSPGEQFELAMSKRIMTYLQIKEKEYSVTVQVVRLGDCAVYAFPFEMFCQFGEMVKKNSPTDKNIFGTLCNGHTSYIPVKELFMPTVYESRLGTSSFLEPEAGYEIADSLTEIAKKLF